MKTRSEGRAKESKSPGEGVDAGHFDLAREIGAAHVCESDAEFNEEVFEFLNDVWREHEEELCYDPI